MGRPPAQVEDERHFSGIGTIVTPKRARMYPHIVEHKFAYKNRKSPISFACYSSKMFETTKLFSIPEQAAVPQPEANTLNEKAGSNTETDSKRRDWHGD